MTDEKFTFISDVKEKGSIARSSHNKRTHCGKGGCKLPHEYLTKKEREKLNGEVKYYRLNDPMKWDEFKKMPKDIRATYIQQIRERFGVADAVIAENFGVRQTTFASVVNSLGIGLGKGHNIRNGDKEGFLAWWNGVPLLPKDEPETETIASVFEQEVPVGVTAEDIAEDAVFIPPVRTAVPTYGNMTFDCAADIALNTVGVLLGGANVHITVTWEVRPEDEAVGNG